MLAPANNTNIPQYFGSTRKKDGKSKRTEATREGCLACPSRALLDANRLVYPFFMGMLSTSFHMFVL